MAKKQDKAKNPAAVALARLRAEKLTPARRQEIARHAIAVRWQKAKTRKAEKRKPSNS